MRRVRRAYQLKPARRAGDSHGVVSLQRDAVLTVERRNHLRGLLALLFTHRPEHDLRVGGQHERAIGQRIFAQPGMTRRQATEDLLWALLNTPEFVFND